MGAELSTTVEPVGSTSGVLADYLWLRMTAMYGHRWTSSFGDDPRGFAGREWSSELLKFTRRQIDDAIQSCKAGSDGWPPSLPSFKLLCLGIPKFTTLKADIGKRNKPFTRFVWQHLDSYAFTTSDTRSAEALLRSTYDHCVELRMNGAELPDHAAADIGYEKKIYKRQPRDVVLGRLDECMSLLKSNEGTGE